MKLNHIAPLILLASTTAIPMASLAAAPVTSQPSQYSHEASTLLDTIRRDAARAKTSASRLEIYSTESQINWDLHGEELTAIRDDVNDMGRCFLRLQAIRTMLPPSQQKEIDRTEPQVRLMADNVTDAMNYLNANQRAFWRPSYRMNVNNLESESTRVARTLSTYEQYVKTRHEERQLRHELSAKS